MIKRREFIKKSALGTTGIAIGGIRFNAGSYNSIVGANDRINVAVIGIRSQGVSHINTFCSMKNSKNVWLSVLCDTDEQFFAVRSKLVHDKTGIEPLTEWDLRRVFENKDIHAVSMAIPNHWHALATIWACQAGKHVYIEKPSCHNIYEGRKMIEASRKYNVRVQVGFNSRSLSAVNEAIKFMHDGGIGDVYMARGLCIKPRDSFGIVKDSEPPSTLHYDQWLGPAPWRQYNEKRCHYNWNWFWNTGNGDTGNQGSHQLDIARWGLNENEHPVSVFSGGGIFGIDPRECEQETPNTQSTFFKYKDGKILEFETRGRYSNAESGLETRIGNIFYGTEGYIEINNETWRAFRKRETTPFAGSKESEAKPVDVTSTVGEDGSEHWINFVDAIRSGKNETLTCDIIEGHYSSALPHLANISYRLGRELKFTGNLEKFADDKEANAMLSREYRKPYCIPDKV